jgi:glycine cleavage system transcriptional repressor
MKHWFALSAIGHDRPGIVADLAELIYDCDCNLEDSSMTVLGGEFAVLLLLSGQGPDADERLGMACKHLEWEKQLTIFLRPLEGEPEPYTAGTTHAAYEFYAIGVDKAGIVARVCRSFARHGINIRQLQSQTRPEPQSGTPLYVLRVRLDVPSAVDVGGLRRDLEQVATDLRIEVALEPCPEGADKWALP